MTIFVGRVFFVLTSASLTACAILLRNSCLYSPLFMPINFREEPSPQSYSIGERLAEADALSVAADEHPLRRFGRASFGFWGNPFLRGLLSRLRRYLNGAVMRKSSPFPQKSEGRPNHSAAMGAARLGARTISTPNSRLWSRLGMRPRTRATSATSISAKTTPGSAPAS